MRPIMATIALLFLASACVDVEANDPGKEAFCYGMDDLRPLVEQGVISTANLADRILVLAVQAQSSPDDEFAADVRALVEGISTGEPPTTEEINAVADACSDYAEIDGVF